MKRNGKGVSKPKKRRGKAPGGWWGEVTSGGGETKRAGRWGGYKGVTGMVGEGWAKKQEFEGR